MNKYRNKKTEYNGVMFDSKLEVIVAKELDLMLSGEAIKLWSRQYKMDLIVNGAKVGFYKADFWVKHNDGSEEIIECKGSMKIATSTWRLRWKIVHALYPDFKYTLRTYK